PGIEADLAVLGDLGMGRDPGGVAAARAEPLAAGDPVAARHHDRLCSGRWRIRHHGARHVDPDLTRDLTGHPRGVRPEDRALVEAPTGARIGLADFFDHLDVGWQVDLAAAYG